MFEMHEFFPPIHHYKMTLISQTKVNHSYFMRINKLFVISVSKSNIFYDRIYLNNTKEESKTETRRYINEKS